MALDYGFSVVPFSVATASGNQTISIPSGPGKTPKAVLFLVSRATALDTITAQAMIGGGAADGSTQRAVAVMAENGQPALNADSGSRIDTGACIQITGTVNQGKEARATFVSFGTDQVTINWASGDEPSNAYRGYAVFLWGADMLAGVLNLKSSGSLNGTVATTAPGVTPDGLIALSVGQDFAADLGTTVARLSVGFAGRSSGGNAAATVTAEDNAAGSTSSGSMVRTDACVSTITGVAGAVTETARVQVSSWDSTGFTIKSLTASAVDAMYLWFRVAGRNVYVGSPTLNVDTSGQSTETAPGRRGCFIMAAGTRVTAADSVSNTTGSISVGAASSASGTQACVTWNARDGIGTSGTQSLTSSANMVDAVSTATLHEYVLNHVAFTATGYTYNVSSTAAADSPVAILVVEEPPPTGAMTVARAVLAGAATERFTASGALAVQRAALSGAAAERFQASGSLTAGATVLSGAALERFAASGAVLRPPTVLAGSALEKVAASGAAAAAAAVLAGSAAERFASSGSILTAAAILAGSAAGRLSASGALSVGVAVLAGSAAERASASGAVSAAPTVLAGSALEKVAASGAVSQAAAILAGSATAAAAVAITASGGVLVGAVVLTAAAAERFLATGVLTVPAAVLAGTDAEAIADVHVLAAGRRLLLDLLAGHAAATDLSAGRRVVYDLGGGI